jgi:polyhydroxyalkanoate synthesis repressor PhaR
MIVIKRYQNRKLYNTDSKEYITLSGISQIIKSGKDIRVIDNDTGDNITADTLTQIIFLQEKEQKDFLPGSVLVSLIRSGGDRITAIQKLIFDQFDLSKQIDKEIQYRVYSLVHKGYLSEEEGAELIEKLILKAEKYKHYNIERNLDFRVNEEQIENYLMGKNLPTKEDLNHLSNRIDQLNEKISKLIK